jgi:hypothetical protein
MAAMTTESERIMYLCQRIQEEQDRAELTRLIKELNGLLARPEDHLESEQPKAQ